MVKRYFASLRLAFALVCVGASLILSAQWFGYFPDAAVERAHARQVFCETVAIDSASHVRKQRWVDLRTTLQTLVDRNDDLLSVGIRSDMNVLRVDTGHHREVVAEHEKIKESAPEKLTGVDLVTVPISMNRRPWGRVEFCFQQPHTTTFARTMHHPSIRLLIYFFVVGLFAFSFFAARLMGIFQETQVVPDRVRQALDTLAEGLLVLDENGCIVLANQAFAELVGSAPNELVHRLASDLAWSDECLDESSFPWTEAIEKTVLQTERILNYTLASGEHRIFSVNAAPLGKDNSQRGALATFRDVTHVEEHRAELERMLTLLRNSRDEIEQKNHELEILATRDSLTGCFNRRAFFDQFETLWKDSTSNKKPMACFMIDIDHFKSINDTLGHSAGDDVLRAVAGVVREQQAENGLLCRYGGEEFCVLLPGFTLDQAMEQAESNRKAIGALRLEDYPDLRMTASIGVSEMRFDPKDPQDLINQADACLYIAKREGRNRSIVFNKSYAVAEATDQIEKAIKREQINIPYQAVTALVSALSYRDAATAEHSRRVADLCARASDGLLDPSQKFVLEIAALLHDIGKIGVPDDILFKPGPLTDDEWAVMQRHDRIGAEIASASFDCPPLAEIMANHHAFYDGKSRERDLPAGDEIPIGARLLAIADSYDAMTNDRVYRKGRTHQEAVVELRRCAGTQFDAQLVDHFIANVEGRSPAVASGAIAIQKQTAILLGEQLQQMTMAVANSDLNQIKELAESIAQTAYIADLASVSSVAESVASTVDSENSEWFDVLRQTHDLLDLCRTSQSEMLSGALVWESMQVNAE